MSFKNWSFGKATAQIFFLERATIMRAQEENLQQSQRSQKTTFESRSVHRQLSLKF